jgi:hypothetical protein
VPDPLLDPRAKLVKLGRNRHHRGRELQHRGPVHPAQQGTHRNVHRRVRAAQSAQWNSRRFSGLHGGGCAGRLRQRSGLLHLQRVGGEHDASVQSESRGHLRDVVDVELHQDLVLPTGRYSAQSCGSGVDSELCEFGTPDASFTGFDFDEYFFDHQIIISNDFCGTGLGKSMFIWGDVAVSVELLGYGGELSGGL